MKVELKVGKKLLEGGCRVDKRASSIIIIQFVVGIVSKRSKVFPQRSERTAGASRGMICWKRLGRPSQCQLDEVGLGI